MAYRVKYCCQLVVFYKTIQTTPGIIVAGVKLGKGWHNCGRGSIIDEARQFSVWIIHLLVVTFYIYLSSSCCSSGALGIA